MRFDTSQHMKLGQHMKLAPRMIQSMEILQMPLAELEERIEQELENNATLELAEGEGDAGELAREQREAERDASENERPLKVDEGGSEADFERLESYAEANPDAGDNEDSIEDRAPPERDYSERVRRDAGERDAKMDAMAAAPARSASPAEQLREQWRLADVDESLLPAGEQIIGYLDDDGFLRTPLETILDRMPPGDARPTREHMQRALLALQTLLDPPGVAARDLREALVLQIDSPMLDGSPPGVRDAARRLVADHLDDLMQNRLPRIAEKTGLSLEQIKAAMEAMRGLSLAPGRALSQDSEPGIIPDAIVEYDEEGDRYYAYLNDTRLPNLRVNEEYAKMARDKAVPKKDRDFIKTNLANAQWLLDAVGQRKHTLLRVIRVVVDAQREFFDFGPQALKPLPMTQVADQLGIHVATVSRAVADKYLQTPRGVVALRKFFSGGLSTESGQDMSYDAVRAALKEVVDAEDKASPLSDDAIADALKGKGIEIARRTVAKYRDQLGVPSARMRKVF